MLSAIQIAGMILLGGVALTFASETFADTVSRVMEAAFDRIGYALALRARTRAERIKARRREDRRRATRAAADTAYA
ncbi:MAG TPA: hypothetical protein VGP08_05335 [Pyrinomonadaceae bacterium]|jgi:hypothetical protein|nr:hypothetical protein [Pyrinomonadaceae bacterium]